MVKPMEEPTPPTPPTPSTPPTPAQPKPKLDCAQIAKLAGEGATLQEIANLLGFTVKHILWRCHRQFNCGCAQRHVLLRQLQGREAKQGNVPVLIHLGKAELGQGQNPDAQTAIPEPRLPYKMG